MVDLLTAADNRLPPEDGDEHLDIELIAAYRNAKKELHSFDAVETPYGTLMENVVFAEGEPDADGDFPTMRFDVAPCNSFEGVLQLFRQTRHNSSHICMQTRCVLVISTGPTKPERISHGTGVL